MKAEKCNLTLSCWHFHYRRKQKDTKKNKKIKKRKRKAPNGETSTCILHYSRTKKSSSTPIPPSAHRRRRPPPILLLLFPELTLGYRRSPLNLRYSLPLSLSLSLSVCIQMCSSTDVFDFALLDSPDVNSECQGSFPVKVSDWEIVLLPRIRRGVVSTPSSLQFWSVLLFRIGLISLRALPTVTSYELILYNAQGRSYWWGFALIYLLWLLYEQGGCTLPSPLACRIFLSLGCWLLDGLRGK